MAADGGKRSQVSVPPRKINLQKFADCRASELDTLHSIVAGRLNNDFRSRRNKRRRTTAYDSRAAKKRYRKRSRLGVVDQSNALALDTDQKRLPRCALRRLELKKNPPNGFSTSGDGTMRLRTHVWHAKRFRMDKLWGFYLPLGLQGRGRGSRALLKWFKNGVLLHDASYYVAVQLDGPEDSLISILRMVLVPSPSAQSEDNNSSVLSGLICGTAMLHHLGAPSSQSIAPVIYMWRPLHLQNRETTGNKCDSGVCNNTQSDESCSPYRQLWVWIHPLAFNEGCDALRLACQKQMSESGLLINCLSLEGQLARFEVMGSKAFQILKRTLHPVTCNSKNSWQLKKCSVVGADHETESKKSFVPEDKNIPSRSVLSLTVKDPRTLPKKSITDGTVSAATIINNVPEDEAKEHVTLPDILDKSQVLLSSPMSKPKWNDSLHDGKNLWNASSRTILPVEENILCLEKHHSQMDFVCLDYLKAEISNSSTELQSSRCCPILLLENRNSKGLHIGWSLILPLSWARVFWNSIISKGAHAIGLQEKRWVACEVGLPYFPSDFPDCNAYSSFMVAEEANIKQNAEKLPPSVRPFKVPVPSPWNTVRATLDKGLSAMGDTQNCCDHVMADRNSLSHTKCCDCSTTPLSSHVNSLDGIVARTSSVLTDYLNEIHGDRLLLFPEFRNKTGALQFMMDENKFGDGASQITSDHKLCYLRVLLHAYKEGVFEEGAVVCAPLLDDILLWTSRSENIEGGLQIPQSSVSSYFKQHLCGDWELQIPQDPVSKGSHRWPIGFVTTGFVRGSKKPIAEAFCEATLLACLREEQWKRMPEKQRRTEIYVLVRNLRSSAYRLGLATIVLEQQEDDVEFL